MKYNEHERAAQRAWALDMACNRNKQASTEKVLQEAELFSQFIERRTDADVLTLSEGGKVGK